MIKGFIVLGVALLYLGFIWFVGKFCGFNEQTPK